MNYGEIINLGRHKLLCGDATKYEDVSKLCEDIRAKILFTSPPYADLRDYSGSDNSPAKLAGFIETFKDYCEVMCVNLGFKRKNHEVIQYWDEYITRAKKSGLKLLSWNVWDKLNPGSITQQQAMFPIRHEFIFVFGAKPFKLNRTIPKHGKKDLRGFTGLRDADGQVLCRNRNAQIHEANKQLETVISCHSEKARPVWGPAQMPVKLAREYILACTNEGDYVIDPFGGSGTTLIACEQTNRKCLMMEISPEYCDVIRKRYEKECL